MTIVNTVDKKEIMLYCAYSISYLHPHMVPVPLAPHHSTPWYKQPAGGIFVVILACVILGLIGFAGLAGYYVWQIQKGETPAIATVIQSDRLTVDTTRALQTPQVIETNITSFIRPHNPTLGPSSAPVTILTFIDFECPFCQEAYPTFTEIVKTYGPIVRVVFKHFPITEIHPQSRRAALAATCAQEQNRFWEYYHELFKEKRLGEDTLLAHARTIQLDETQFRDCLAQERYQKNIDEDLLDVQALGVRGTPTYFVNQTKLEGVTNKETWRDVILRALKDTPKTK